MVTRKVSAHPAGSKFIYLPKKWYEQQKAIGWDGKEVEVSNTSTLLVKPYPAKKPSIIISATPLRLPLGGGGSDILEYYSTHNGGTWISATIDNYIHIILKRRFETQSKFVYSQTQYVDDPSQFNHPILRAVFTKYNLIQHLELISLADLPSHLGLGSSGAFTVGLLKAVHAYLNLERSAMEVAEEAYEIERFTLGRKIGKQDQYASACGGFNIYCADAKGNVTTTPLNVPDLQKWLLLFYVDQREISADQAISQISIIDREKIAHIGEQSIDALLNNDFQQYGSLMDAHWQIKSKTQPQHFSNLIDLAKTYGAIAGKLIGAGAGGCILIMCPPEHQLAVIEQFQSSKFQLSNCIQIPFQFTFFGAEVYA